MLDWIRTKLTQVSHIFNKITQISGILKFNVKKMY